MPDKTATAQIVNVNSRYQRIGASFSVSSSFECLASTATVECGSLPNPQLTPGGTLGVTKADICTPSCTRVVRAVRAALKLSAKSTQPTADREERAFVVRWTI